MKNKVVLAWHKGRSEFIFEKIHRKKLSLVLKVYQFQVEEKCNRMKKMSDRFLKMKFAGRFIDLLGHQMYGGAVPAVAEFVANAWDADSKKVEVSIPEDITAEGAEIIVRDYGEGMTFDELNDYYLNIGYERRKTRGEKTAGGRLVMGRKGIGKLAGFGIAEDIVLRSVKDGRVVEFNLNYTELKSKQELTGFKFKPDVDEKTDEENGVLIKLKNLALKQNINLNSFKKSLGRRFALKSEKMEINVNGEALTRESLDFDHRTPTTGWTKEKIPGFGEVEYWFGFLKNTIKDKELRGTSVFARDRVAQFTPFFFNLSGGINGQVGLEYLTGQVKANELDEKIDHVATPRNAVNWQFGNAPLLETWGQDKIKELCKDWKTRKDQKNLDKFKHDYSDLSPRIDALSKQEKKDITAALEKIAGLERMEEKDFMVIASSMLSGVERESVKKVIRRINDIEEGALPELLNVIEEWDIISAVSIAELVKGKIEIIEQFEKHIDERVPEKSKGDLLDMQTFIRDHSWLLGHEYEQLKSADIYNEKGVDKWIVDVLKETDKEYTDKDKKEGKRFDLLCIKDRRSIVLIELMRPGVAADYDHLSRLERYRTRVESAIEKKGTGEQFGNMIVTGLLIADNFMDDSALTKSIAKLRPSIEVFEWKALFEQVQARYKDYLDVLKERAPDDPRIKGIIDLGSK